MSMFWLLAIALAILALLFTIPPLLRSNTSRKIGRNQLTAEIVKEQLAELTSDLEAGKLDQASHAAARHDLERALLDDLDKPTIRAQPERSGRWAAGLLAIGVPACALYLYHQLGTQNSFTKKSANPVATTPAKQISPGEINAMVSKLAERMRENPDNVEGWIMLANSYATMSRFSEAAAAYKKVVKHTSDNPAILTDYADVLAMANDGEFTNESEKLLRKALQLQPGNVKALWLMGHLHNQHEQFQSALTSWRKAASLLPPGDKNAATLNQQINFVQNKLGMTATKPAATTARENPAGTNKASIKTTVSLDPALKNKASPEDTVFIFARAANGPRMPLAIVRKQVKDLPITVTLNDSQAMTAQMALSNFAQVSIGARISKTGNAMPSPGDLTGNTGPVATNQNQAVEILISEIVP